jgi:hypothetical protein
MPEISRFLGIIIRMFWSEHNPPHFHAIYNDFEAEIEISSLNVKSGKLPAKVLGLVLEWAELHQEELMQNWKSLQTTKDYKKIKPLV